MGTLNMLGLAKRVKARFLISSTSGMSSSRSKIWEFAMTSVLEVYGDPEVHPQHEE